MGESLTEQCRVEVEGPRVMNFFSRRRSNDVKYNKACFHFTQVEDFESIKDISKLADCERKAFSFARKLLKERRSINNIEEIVKAAKEFNL
ncbi:hypothetical protein QQ045_031341 [Rhodiola kirilowii]